MTTFAPDASLTKDPFDLSLASPLPEIPQRPLDPISSAQNLAFESDELNAPVDIRTEAWMLLSDAWMSVRAVSPALEALGHASALMPLHPALLERLIDILPCAGRHREAAAALEALGPHPGSAHTWLMAARAWLRGDSPHEALRCLAEAQRLNPEGALFDDFELSVARIQSAGSDGSALIERLIEGASRARGRDDRESWRALASDAWIESRGKLSGESLSESLAASGRPREAVYVAAETAARALDHAPERESEPEPSSLRLLVRCARLAETAGLPGEAIAAWTVLSLRSADPRDAREALRDHLAERGRPVELAARLRADARRASSATRAAAWKGVAAIEIVYAPAEAAGALIEALRERPDDAETFELLGALASDPRAESALRDALWSLARAPSLEPAARLRIALWLGQLEERAGDSASAEAALSLVERQSLEAAQGVELRRAEVLRLCAEAHDALAALSSEGALTRPETLETFLATYGARAGAFRDSAQVAQALCPIALRDERFASLWTRIAARSDDRSRRLAVLRRLATRCQVPAVRVRSAVAYAELVDHPDGSPSDAAELLLSLLDELPEEPVAAATLAAIAEHLGDPVLSRGALRAVSRAATDPCERDLLGRFAGSAQGLFAVFAACLCDPKHSHDRASKLAQLHDLLGDSASILAHRTRLLLAQNSPLRDGLDLARRFSDFDPCSPEAAIAWFGAASLAGEVQDIALAARAVSSSLASARDLASVTRAAVSRLVALGQSPVAFDLASEIAASNGVPDHALRAQLIELVQGFYDHPGAVPMLESLCASGESSNSPLQLRDALRALVLAHHQQGNALGESSSRKRLRALWSEAPIDPSDPDPELAALARSTLEQLSSTSDTDARRELHLRAAALEVALHPGDLDPAAAALDRYADELQDDLAQGEVTRALLSLGLAEHAIVRLLRWAELCVTPRESALRGIAAATIAYARLGDPSRALGLLREQLSRDEGVPEALALAESIAADSGSHEALFAIYQELSVNAAGAYGREALAYRRANYLERTGQLDAALDAHFTLFEHTPTLGASFSAIQRIADALSRYDTLVRGLTLLAEVSPTPESRASFFRRAAEVSRSQDHNPLVALSHDLSAYTSHPEASQERALLDHARSLAPLHPDAARAAIEQVIDRILAAGNQTWDDTARRAYALHAAELAITEADDPQRTADAVSLFMGQHEDPPQGRSEILDLLDRTSASESIRRAVQQVHGISRPSWRPATALRVPAAVAPAEATDTVEHRVEDLVEDTGEDTGSLPPPPPLNPAEAAVVSIPPTPRIEAPATRQRSATELRAASSQGDDAAAAALATRLAGREESRDEALLIQRQRFMEDPSRLDALGAMVKLYRWMGMPTEGDALESVLTVLSGGSSGLTPPLLQDLSEPPEGVARVLFPPRWSAFAELGGLLWQSLGHLYRRSSTRNPAEAQRAADPSSQVGRMFQGGLRLLELPLTTSLVLREEVPEGAAITLTQPPGVALTRSLATDTPRTRFLLGRMLEGARPVHCLIAALDAHDAQRLLDAVLVSVGAEVSRPDGFVRQLATNMGEILPPRTLKRIEDLVSELGPRLSYPAWRDAVELSRAHAGMLLSGDFQTASHEVLSAHPGGGEVPNALRVNEHLRELTRFACSEVYLLLRWQNPP